WLANKLDAIDRDKQAREALAEMKRDAGPGTGSKAKYARTEDIPGLPPYDETEPGQQRTTIEEKPRGQKPSVQVASAASSTLSTWRRNAVPFGALTAKPLIAPVI